MTRPDDPDRRITVGNSQMTRQQIMGALEANITLAKDGAADLLHDLERLPATAERAGVVKKAQSVQGLLGGVVLPLVRALVDDAQEPSS